MKAFRQFGALVVLFVWAVIPMMACGMPAAQMTLAERACCRQMKMSCGDMGMPSSHGCCNKTVQADHTVAVYAKVAAVQPDMAVASQLSALLPTPTFQQHFRPESLDTSPPQPPPAALNVLRI